MSDPAYTALPVSAEDGSANAKPIPGDVYMWLAKGEQEITKKSRTKRGTAMMIVLLQIVVPPALAYYQCARINWDTSWKFDINLMAQIDYSKKAPGNPLPLWPITVTKKIVAVIVYYMFMQNQHKKLMSKAQSMAKMKLAEFIESKGDKFWLFLAAPTLAISYFTMCFGTWLALLGYSNAQQVMVCVGGLAILTTMDSVGGLNLSPLTDEDWDAAAQGQEYYKKVKSQYPDVDPNDMAAMEKYLAPHRGFLLPIVNWILYGSSFVFSVLFLFIDQTAIEYYNGPLM